MNMPELSKVIVVGASGFGRETLDVLEAMRQESGRLEVIGVVDDSISVLNLGRLCERGVTFLGTTTEWLKTGPVDVKFSVGVGSPVIRRRLVARLEAAGLRAFTAIHPSAVIGSKTNIASGSVVCAGAVISTNVRLGSHVHVNPNATIGHDSILEDFVSVNPTANISGEVNVKSGTVVGAGAIILQNIHIAEDVIIGAGSVVTKSIPSGAIVKGVPGRW